MIQEPRVLLATAVRSCTQDSINYFEHTYDSTSRFFFRNETEVERSIYTRTSSHNCVNLNTAPTQSEYISHLDVAATIPSRNTLLFGTNNF